MARFSVNLDVDSCVANSAFGLVGWFSHIYLSDYISAVSLAIGLAVAGLFKFRFLED